MFACGGRFSSTIMGQFSRTLSVNALVGSMDKALNDKGLDSKVDQQTQMIIALVQVEQTLLYVFWLDLAGSFHFEDELIMGIFNNEINTPPGNNDALITDGDFYLALIIQAAFSQSNCQGALVIYFHAVHSQLPLNVLAGTNYVIGQ
jgi:hypothetical protein